MADPFEVRMRFTGHLQHLNASVNSAQKATQFALKHKDLHEDLHSCIIEQLELSRNMNIRANIMYFIGHFVENASKDGQQDYVRMMQRDIVRVVDAVAPPQGNGAANVKVVRSVLAGLHSKGFLLKETLVEIDEILRDRETGDIGLSSPSGEEENSHSPASPGQKRPIIMLSMDKKQVEQRIEEDRERHKRLRETMWAVPNTDKAKPEWEKIWEETSDWGDDDDLLASEEAEEHEREWSAFCPHMKKTPHGYSNHNR